MCHIYIYIYTQYIHLYIYTILLLYTICYILYLCTDLLPGETSAKTSRGLRSTGSTKAPTLGCQ